MQSPRTSVIFIRSDGYSGLSLLSSFPGMFSTFLERRSHCGHSCLVFMRLFYIDGWNRGRIKYGSKGKHSDFWRINNPTRHNTKGSMMFICIVDAMRLIKLIIIIIL